MQDQNDNLKQENEDEENLVQVATYSNQMDAALAQATLEAAGIQSSVSHDDAGVMLQYMDYVSGIRLFTSEEHAEEARTLLGQQAITDSENEQQV